MERIAFNRIKNRNKLNVYDNGEESSDKGMETWIYYISKCSA